MVTTQERTTASPRFDWAVAGGSTLLFGGVVLDGWAHHNLASALETFFTPWHAVLYSGFAVVSAVLVIPAVRSRRSGLRRSLPDGYLPSLLGVALFLVGGAADLVWHAVFGIEVDLEAALSPTHLLLLAGGVLVLSGPLRSAWRTAPGGHAPLPAIVSLVLASSLIGFFAEFGSVFNTLWPAGRTATQMPGAVELPPEGGQLLGVSSVMLQSAVIAGTLLLLLRRWAPPFGTVTVLFTVGIGIGCLVHGTPQLIPAVLLAGLVGDALIALARPAAGRVVALRIVSGAVPLVLFALYFLALAVTDRVTWPVELWTGSILIACATGLLTSYVAAPWCSPVEHDRKA